MGVVPFRTRRSVSGTHRLGTRRVWLYFVHTRGVILPSSHLDSSVRGSCVASSEGESFDSMSSAPRPEDAASSYGVDLSARSAAGANESLQVFQNVEPYHQMYRESAAANVSLEFAQESGMRGVYPSPVATPVAFNYTGFDGQFLAVSTNTTNSATGQGPGSLAQGQPLGLETLRESHTKPLL